MSEHVTHEPPPVEDPNQSLLDKHAFLFRRLHSLSGIVPVGLFVMMHLFTNFQMATGDFQHEVEFIHSLPALFIIEWALWIGIGFHAALGIVYAATGRANTKPYPFGDNWRYSLQRGTGYVAVLFIFIHVATLRWRWNMFGWFSPFFVAGPDGTPLSMATTAKALQYNWAVLLVYILGVASVIYHWSNGLWTAAITWGATVTVNAQRRWGYVCAVIGITLAIFSAGGIVAALNYQLKPGEAYAIEQAQKHYNDGLPLMEKSREILPKPNRVPDAGMYPPMGGFPGGPMGGPGGPGGPMFPDPHARAPRPPKTAAPAPAAPAAPAPHAEAGSTEKAE